MLSTLRYSCGRWEREPYLEPSNLELQTRGEFGRLGVTLKLIIWQLHTPRFNLKKLQKHRCSSCAEKKEVNTRPQIYISATNLPAIGIAIWCQFLSVSPHNYCISIIIMQVALTQLHNTLGAKFYGPFRLIWSDIPEQLPSYTSRSIEYHHWSHII